MSDFIETKNNTETGELNDWEKLISGFLIFAFVLLVLVILFKIFILPVNNDNSEKTNVKKEINVEDVNQKNEKYDIESVQKDINTSGITSDRKIKENLENNTYHQEKNDKKNIDSDTSGSLRKKYKFEVDEEHLKDVTASGRNEE